MPQRRAFGAWCRRGNVGRGFVAALIAILAVGQPAAAAPPEPPEADDPCEGLFALMDRPTVADSSCSVEPGRFLAELGYQSGPIKGSDTGHLAFAPQASLRFGLPDGWEARLFPPNYLLTDIRASAGGGRVDGFGDAAVGAKYQLGTFGGFTLAADAKLTAPSGNAAFSSGAPQGNVQAIASTALTPKLGVLVLVGASSLANRGDDGQVDRFGSLNASFVVGYQLNDRLQLFSEVYGNSVSGPGARGNLSLLGGLQVLLTKSIEFDLEAGTLLTGPQGQQARYFGIGTGLQF